MSSIEITECFLELTHDNIRAICRCCSMNRGEIDLFGIFEKELSFSSLIFACTREMIKKADGLSTVICNKCMKLLINSYNFIVMFRGAQEKLRNFSVVNREQIDVLGNASEGKNDNSDTLIEKQNKKTEETPINREMESEFTEFVASPASDERPTVSEHEQSHNIIQPTPISRPEPLPEKHKKITRKKEAKKMELDPNLMSGLDLQCFQCLTVFCSKAEMVKHHETTSHTMAPNYKCGICSKAISKRKAYWDHMAMHRHLKKKAVCEVCGAVVVSLHLKRHMLVHQDKTHTCQYCGKGYVQKNTLTEHVRKKHEGDEKDLTLCFICGKLCSDLKGLTTHLNTHAEYKLKGLSHRCEDCGKYFLNAQSLSTHTYMAHKHTERIPKQHKRTKTIRQKTKKKTRVKNQTEPQIEEGMTVKKPATKRAPVECSICKKSICYLGYKRHMTTHTGVKPHQCKYCPKSFRLYTSLKSHTYVHLDIKPFKCDVCGQEFRHYTTLKVHRRVHTGEKPYSCPVCSKGFRSASGLKRHQNQRQHHKKDMDDRGDT